MTPPLLPTMLWESADPAVVINQRFGFASSAVAAEWLSATVERTYGLTVTAVDRLVMSSYNLLAWLTTAEGPLLAKCCVFLPAHQRLLNAAELVVWLDQKSLPVSVPLPAKTGPVQVICDHFSIGLQRVIAGELLDPTQLAQADAAGIMLAQLHQALAAYPRASAFAPHDPLPTLPTRIETWATQKLAKHKASALVADINTLQQRAQQLDADSPATQLVHGDYRAANLLWQGEKLAAVLDWEEARWGYRVNDLAWAAVYLGTRYHNWGPVPAIVQQTFLESYTATQPLTAAEQVWLPLLLTWHALSLASR